MVFGTRWELNHYTTDPGPKPPCETPTKEPYGISRIFTTEGLTEGSKSGSLDPKLDALTTDPQINHRQNHKITRREIFITRRKMVSKSLRDKKNSEKSKNQKKILVN